MAKKKTKRKAPMKRADTPEKVRKQLTRFENLLSAWISKSEQALVRVRKYRQKAQYYQKRLDEIRDAERQQLQDELGREQRAIQLRGPDARGTRNNDS